MRRSAKQLAVCACAGLAACATPAADGVGMASTADLSESGTVVTSGPWQATLWLSDTFDGTQSRDLDGNVLRVAMTQFAQGGGLDTSVGRPELEVGKPRVADVRDDAKACFDFDVALDLVDEGRWWAGPKISVNWQDDGDRNGMSGWYENYIIETASIPPGELAVGLLDWGQGVYIGDTVHDGGTYRHYRAKHQSWTQYWAIRQSYRDAGTTSLGPIVAKWEADGLPEELPVDGIKINIETYGPQRGSFTITGDVPGHLGRPASLICDATPA